MKIKILDCTLRDGGYVNEWNFGEKTIKSIVRKLEKAKIDIIECGFLTATEHSKDFSLFNDVTKIESVISKKNKNVMHVAMLALGKNEMHPSQLVKNNGKGIEGIRLTFHKHEITEAVQWAREIITKGYEVFMQPVGLVAYSDFELLDLVQKINELQPYAFYIVDTLGSMHSNYVSHVFYILDENLKEGIRIGFHPHNNLQLAYANSQKLTRIQTKRTIIIDVSVYGMGRGAGNLPTELITQYINKNIMSKYEISDILDIYDEHISLIQQKYDWGYSIAYYIAASYVCHPEYASFLMNKQTLTMKDIENIVFSIPKEERCLYNKTIIEQLYLDYQNKKIDDSAVIKKMTKLLETKSVLVLAPGKSLKKNYNQILEFTKKENSYVISVNFADSQFEIATCFVSNHRRVDNIIRELDTTKICSVIMTSNISLVESSKYTYIDYYSYINPDEMVFDNAGLMLLRFLKTCLVKRVILAGFDGFQSHYNENYYNEELNVKTNEMELNEKQNRIKTQLHEMMEEMKIEFLTPSLYE